ncbi:MAG: GGDEF domain-containing protein [Thiohalophilus sp.]|nr:GGDEF domain-containing protein [Thiohalophilus sp.]MDR9437845.1 GGDEF domain-containing protein [Thiohalophilus sp.]
MTIDKTMRSKEPAGDLSESPATKQRFAWQWWPAVCVILTGFYVALPYGRLASIVYVLTSLIAALAVGFAAYNRRQLVQPAAWKLIAIALSFAALGHSIWYWLDLQGLTPFPSVADIFYLAVYPLFMAALYKLERQKGQSEGAMSDALLVGTSAAVLGWVLLIAPYMNDPSLSLGQFLISAAYPIADLIVLPLILYLVFLQRARILANLFLLAGILSYLAADLLYAHGNLVGWYAPGGLTDSLWLLSYAFFVAAVHHPSASVEAHAETSNAQLSQRRIVILGIATILVPMVILFQTGTEMETVKVAAFASIVLFLLVMHRMGGLLKETQQQAEALERLSKIDPLTGAANRRELSNDLAREIARSERVNAPLSLAFLDLDHFKDFNDTRGHSAGDVLLQELVKAWEKEMRPPDVLARFGGEEFVIVFPDTDIEQGRKVLERLLKLVPFGQTCSAGLVRREPGDTADTMMRRADKALYLAKDRGRDRIVCS